MTFPIYNYVQASSKASRAYMLYPIAEVSVTLRWYFQLFDMTTSVKGITFKSFHIFVFLHCCHVICVMSVYDFDIFSV